MKPSRILKPGRNCWRIRRADRVAFLVDGEDYFRVLHASIPLAERQLLILAWDLYSRLHLVPGEGDETPPSLDELLDTRVRHNRHLQAYLLSWDFSMLFALSREWLPIYKLDWKTHRRLHFHMDDHCPNGASHHQKVVVIDDRLAFAGGLDLTRGRWDTPEHRPRDPRRLRIDGTRGRPYHDIQMAVSGPAATALGDLARERWRRATGRRLEASGESPDRHLWPEGLQADLEDVDVAIARTEPALEGYAEVREVQQLYLDAIAAARSYIYIENQYFTSQTVADALCERLREENGPEVVLNLPLATEGWLAQQSMDIMRVHLIRRMREADRHGRLAVVYPGNVDDDALPINLHAKLMIIDDRFVRIGSSNLNNRSMGLDTECDLAIEVPADDERATSGIAGFRDRLLAEHLAVLPGQAANTIAARGSLLRAIEELRGDGRTLRPLEPELPEVGAHELLTDPELMDPDHGLDSEALLNTFVPEQDTRPAGRRVLGWVLALTVLLGMAVAWRYTPLSEWLDIEQMRQTLAGWRTLPATPFLVIAVFILAGLVVMPLTALVIATVLALGPWLGFVYALAGALASALVGYGIGAKLGRQRVRRLAGKRINSVSRQLAKRGLLTTLVVRVVPVAPFTVVNLVAGASHIQFRDFAIGTLLGMTPGLLGIVLLTDRVWASLRSPGWDTLATLVLVGVVIIGLGYLLSRQLIRRSGEGPTDEHAPIAD